MARYFNPVAQILTDSGRIAPGAKINFYVNNDTSTRQNTYADANLSVVNPNPVVMGADGRPQHEIFLPDDAIYTLVFTYSDDVQFAQVDDYTGANSDVVGILAGLGITISASELQIDLDVDLNGDLDISGTPKISTNNVALTGVASSGFPPADIPLIKANASDQVEIDPDGNGTLVSGTLDASGLVSLIYTDDSGATGLKLGTAGVASGYIFSDDNVNIDIDHNNNSTGASFSVTKDSGATTLFSVAESGDATFSGDVEFGDYSNPAVSIGQLFAGALRASSTTSTGTSTHNAFVNPNGQVGSITTNGTATAFNTSSDPRLKSEFVEIDHELAAKMVCDTIENKWVGVFYFLDKEGNPNGEAIAGYNAHALIDNQATYGGSEGEGPRDLKIGEVYKEAVMDTRPVMVPELDEDGEPTGEMIDSGEVEEYEKEPALVVTPAGVDQSKRAPLLEAALYNALKRIEALESK